MRTRSLSRKEPERKPPVRRVKSKRPLKKSVVIPLLFYIYSSDPSPISRAC